VLAFFVSLLGLILATYTDLKKRIVPNELNLFLTISGFCIYGASSLLLMSWLPLILSFASFSYSFILAYLLYKVGFWAGGDVKLFAALGCINPVNPFFARLFGFTGFISTKPLFPAELFVFTLFSMLPVTIALLVLRADRKLRAKLLLLLALIVMLEALSFIVPLKPIASLLSTLALLLLAYFFLFCFPLAKLVFTRNVKISELHEGDIPAESIKLVDGKVLREKGFNMKKLINYMVQYKMGKTVGEEIVSPVHARGVALQEIAKLKKLVANGLLEDSILIKESLPMVPAILTAYLILNFTGDLLWLMLA